MESHVISNFSSKLICMHVPEEWVLKWQIGTVKFLSVLVSLYVQTMSGCVLILVRLCFYRLIFRVTKLQQDVLQAEEREVNTSKRVKDE